MTNLELTLLLLAVAIPVVVGIWAVSTHRPHAWLVVPLAFVGVIGAEVCVVFVWLVLIGATPGAVFVVGASAALSVASFVSLVRVTARRSERPS